MSGNESKETAEPIYGKAGWQDFGQVGREDLTAVFPEELDPRPEADQLRPKKKGKPRKFQAVEPPEASATEPVTPSVTDYDVLLYGSGGHHTSVGGMKRDGSTNNEKRKSKKRPLQLTYLEKV